MKNSNEVTVKPKHAQIKLTGDVLAVKIQVNQLQNIVDRLEKSHFKSGNLKKRQIIRNLQIEIMKAKYHVSLLLNPPKVV